MNKLKPQSRKLLVLIISAVCFVVNEFTGKSVSEDAMMTLLGFAGAYILAQGVADHGTQGAANAVRRALKEGKEVAQAVQGVLGPNVSEFQDDGPNWEDTSKQDDEDKAK
jgi:hypothetical protein